MGVVLSSTATLSRFSLATGIIGLISFAFTVSTFLKVVWTNLETIGEAPHEVHSYLTNLRQELVEERTSLRDMRRASRDLKKRCARRRQERSSHPSSTRAQSRSRAGSIDVGVELISEVTLKTMTDVVKRLIHAFAELERPFLEPGEPGITEILHRAHRPSSPRNPSRRPRRKSSARRRTHRDGSVSPYYSHEAYASAPSATLEKPSRPDPRRSSSKDYGARRIADLYDSEADEGDIFWAQRTKYAEYSLIKRLRWLRAKPRAENLFAVLSRVQVRRIAQQVGILTRANHEYGQSMLDAQEAVWRIDERTSRFVGVRRVDDSR